jgi:hypothetical protein
MLKEEIVEPKTRVHFLLSEILALHEALRRLGIQAKDIFILAQDSGELGVQMRQNEKLGCLKIAELPVDEQRTFLELWPLAVEAWNKEMSDEQRDSIYLHARCLNSGNKIKLVRGLIEKGFNLHRD